MRHPCTFQDEEETDTLGLNTAGVTLAFNVYTNRINDRAVPESIIDRLRTVYHLQIPALTGYKFTKMARVGGVEIYEDDVAFHFAEMYWVEITDDSADPS